MYSSSSFADSSSTPPSDSSSTFKVNSQRTQIMLKSKLTAAFEDELGAQQKLSKQQAAAEKVPVKTALQSALANDMTPNYKSQRIAERSRSSLSSSHSIKEKDRKKSNSSSSGREKVSSRGLESSGRHSDSGSKRSDHHRRDGDKKKDAKDHDLHRPRSKDDIPKQAKSSSIKKVVVDKELYDSSQPLNSDDAVPISVALKDKLAAQQKEKDRPLNSHDDVPKPAATTKMAKSDPKSIRSFSRDSLKDALWSRCKEAKDLESDESIVEQIAEEIENSLFSLFKNVGVKYKNKYRSLIYNIKDKKNPTLFRKIITKQITPDELVKMSTEDLAYKDLAEWRKNEAKREMDLIEKVERERTGVTPKTLITTKKGLFELEGVVH